MGCWLACWIVLVWMTTLWPAHAVPQPGRDYLLTGQATSDSTPRRGCTPARLSGPRQQLLIPAPPRGWSGEPQALAVFNVYAGEVQVRHGARETCGNMGDARTRDSRFRAGIGSVFVPPAGSTEPVHVSWPAPLKARWGPTLLLGSPSPVQQNDTARLLVRAACLAVALALALNALMGYVGARDRIFLSYIGLTAVFVLWQALLGGLSGYPEPWLPVAWSGGGRLLFMTACVEALLLPLLWRLCGGDRVLPAVQHARRVLSLLLLVVACSTVFMGRAALGRVAQGLEITYVAGAGLALLVGLVACARGDRRAFQGLAAVAPFAVMIVADLASAHWMLVYRVEALQLSVTWLLLVAAYALNHRIGRLRQQRDEMRQLADTDALTGLLNRRAGLRALGEQLQRSAQSGDVLAVGFLDIDLFKDINDRHGHAVGDAVLVAVAGALRGAVRTSDAVFRMGGEEFLLILPGASRAVARQRMDAVRQAVSDAGSALAVDALRVTASIGLAQWRGAGDDLAALLRRADHAMYAAKRAGRDRVEEGAD